MVSGLPALPTLTISPVLDADVALDDAPVVDDQRVGDHQVERALGCASARLLWPMPSRITLPPPKVISSP